MTKDERFQQLALATTLGRVCLLWGVVEGSTGALICECRKKAQCPKPGKHGRKGWKQSATADLSQLLIWTEIHPNANFGILMGEHVIAVDADIRHDQGKHGVAVLEFLEIGAGMRIPNTVTVLSGRNNGSRHQFFAKPETPSDSLESPFCGVDLIRNGMVVAPGSRHVSGHFYRFADECNPVDQEVVPMPGFLLAAFTKKQSIVTPNTTAVTKGRLRPDWVVERQIKRDPAAGPLFAGKRNTRRPNGTFDRSRDDFSLCKYLAFYCAHHWQQYCRMFEKSALYGEKNDKGYVERTLRRAFTANTANWIERKRKSRATGAKRGRALAPNTLAVISLHQHDPELNAVEIAEQVGCTASKVRNILHRFRNGFYSIPSQNTDCLHIEGIATGISFVPNRFTDPEELVSAEGSPGGTAHPTLQLV